MARNTADENPAHAQPAGISTNQELIEELPSSLEKHLAEQLAPGETVLLKLKGAFKEGLVCTDARVMILKAGFMAGQTFGKDVFQQNYRNIAGVQVKYNLLSGYFEVNASGMQNTTKSYWSTNSSTDPAKAPNCISINQKAQKLKFQQACAFILAKVEQIHTQQSAPAASTSAQDDLLEAVAKLGKLHEAGILTDQEFETKKAELLQRL
jgi:hypothetical protein